MKNPFSKALKKHSGKDPSDADQKALGKPKAAALGDEHKDFLKEILGLIDAGTIDTKNTDTFVNEDVYKGLDLTMRAKVERAMPNIISLLERIMDLHARPEQDESFEMKNLIECLWQAKERIEKHADVFIF